MSLKIYGDHDERTVAQLQRCVDAEPGAIGVLCADGHLGYSMPIGGVVGYRDHVSPSGVGYDIACGNLAVKTNLMIGDLDQAEMIKIADEIATRVSFGIGRKNNEPIDSPVFDLIRESPVPAQRRMLQLAQNQLGTVGSGNHYVDILSDESGRLWVAVHFGSRGFGHKTATGFLNIAAGKAFDDRGHDGDMDAPPLLLNIHLPAGQDYIEAMKIAGAYAYAGREAVVNKVLDILGARASVSVHNHHNFAWEETHFGETRWVVRKGATPAFENQAGFVGGSMGDISVILMGNGLGADTLHSTVHGAGRVMSRTQAAGKMKWHKATWQCGNRDCTFVAPIRDFERGRGNARPTCPIETCGSKLNRREGWKERLEGGLVSFTLEKEKLEARGIILRGAGADEAPPVYRKLGSVLAAHEHSIDIVHVLHPLIVVMAGANEHDPYKD